MEKAVILRGPRGNSTQPDKGMEDALIPLPTPCQEVPELLEGPSNVLQATDQVLDDNEGIAHRTTAQTVFYTHRGLDGRSFDIRPGAKLLPTPTPHMAEMLAQ